jgi:tetratricopeptide (TPR) repeat protein
MKAYIFLSIFVSSLFAGTAMSQDAEKYDPILFMIIDREYEKAISKLERFQKKDKTRRDPEPYLLMSMAYYEISKDESLREEYPRAFRDAIKFAYKGARYDKEGEYVEKHSAYVSELKIEIMKEARFYYDEGSWRKSVTNAKYVTRIDPNDLAALLLKGSGEMRGRNEFQGKMTFEEAIELAEKSSPSDFKSEQLPFLLFSLMEASQILKENGEKSKANALLALGEKTFEEDTEFQNFLANY